MKLLLTNEFSTKMQHLDNVIAKLSKERRPRQARQRRSGGAILLVSEAKNVCVSLATLDEVGDAGERDLHQCGHCKLMFCSMTKYITHKLQKTCQLEATEEFACSSGAVELSSPDGSTRLEDDLDGNNGSKNDDVDDDDEVSSEKRKTRKGCVVRRIKQADRAENVRGVGYRGDISHGYDVEGSQMIEQLQKDYEKRKGTDERTIDFSKHGLLRNPSNSDADSPCRSYASYLSASPASRDPYLIHARSVADEKVRTETSKKASDLSKSKHKDVRYVSSANANNNQMLLDLPQVTSSRGSPLFGNTVLGRSDYGRVSRQSPVTRGYSASRTSPSDTSHDARSLANAQMYLRDRLHAYGRTHVDKPPSSVNGTSHANTLKHSGGKSYLHNSYEKYVADDSQGKQGTNTASMLTPYYLDQPIASKNEDSQPITSQSEHSQPIASHNEHSQSITSQKHHSQPITLQNEHSQPITSQNKHSQSFSASQNEHSDPKISQNEDSSMQEKHDEINAQGDSPQETMGMLQLHQQQRGYNQISSGVDAIVGDSITMVGQRELDDLVEKISEGEEDVEQEVGLKVNEPLPNVGNVERENEIPDQAILSSVVGDTINNSLQSEEEETMISPRRHSDVTSRHEPEDPEKSPSREAPTFMDFSSPEKEMNSDSNHGNENEEYMAESQPKMAEIQLPSHRRLSEATVEQLITVPLSAAGANDPSWKHAKQMYSCPLCAKVFPFKSKLQRHVLVHTGIKPYKCTVCGRGFTQQIDLQRHLTRHTGEKPFKCHLCTAQFIRADNLKKHCKDSHYINIEEPVRKRRRKTTGSDTVLPSLEVAIALAFSETERNGGRVLGRASAARNAPTAPQKSVIHSEDAAQLNRHPQGPRAGDVPSFIGAYPSNSFSSSQNVRYPFPAQAEGKIPGKNEEGGFPVNTQVRFPGKMEGRFSGNTDGRFSGNTDGRFPGNTDGRFPGNTDERFPGNTDGRYPGNTEGRFIENIGGRFPGNTEGRFPGNTEGRFPGNTEGRFPGNTEGRFPGNTEGRFPGNTEGRFPGKAEGRFPENTEGRFPGNTDVRFPGNTDVRFPGNMEGRLHGNREGRFHGKTEDGGFHGRHPGNTQMRFPGKTEGRFSGNVETQYGRLRGHNFSYNANVNQPRMGSIVRCDVISDRSLAYSDTNNTNTNTALSDLSPNCHQIGQIEKSREQRHGSRDFLSSEQSDLSFPVVDEVFTSSMRADDDAFNRLTYDIAYQDRRVGSEQSNMTAQQCESSNLYTDNVRNLLEHTRYSQASFPSERAGQGAQIVGKETEIVGKETKSQIKFKSDEQGNNKERSTYPQSTHAQSVQLHTSASAYVQIDREPTDYRAQESHILGGSHIPDNLQPTLNTPLDARPSSASRPSSRPTYEFEENYTLNEIPSGCDLKVDPGEYVNETDTENDACSSNEDTKPYIDTDNAHTQKDMYVVADEITVVTRSDDVGTFTEEQKIGRSFSMD